MEHLAAITGGVLAALWLSRVLAYARGLPRVADITTAEWAAARVSYPRLSVIVPAKDEAQAIEGCLTSLLALDYPEMEIIAVDDRSTDATPAIMDRLAAAQPPDRVRLKVIHVSALPDGWMGKTHAMWVGAGRCTGELILFTDGDVSFQPDALRRAVNYMLNKDVDHFVLYPTMIFKSWGEKMMISFFQTMLCFVHRPWKVREPKAIDHIGVGAFNLIRRSTYEAIGTYKAMRMEVIDDLRLGRLVKRDGFKQDVALGHGLATLHWVSGALGIVRNLSKNAFAALRFQWALVIGACAGIAFITLLPVIGLVVVEGGAKAGFALAQAGLAAVYAQTRRITNISPGYFLLHPVAAVLTLYMVVRSAWVTTLRGVSWRGTTYPLRQFRREEAKDWE